VSGDDRFAAERRRILDAYDRRDAAGKDDHPHFGHEDAAHLLRLQHRHRESLRLLRRAGVAGTAGELRTLRILEVGCGDGAQLLHYLGWGLEPANLAGVDLRPAAVDRARRRLPAADLRVGCAGELPWASDTFHLAGLHTVVSSILDPALRRGVAAEVDRVLRPGGAVLFYDTFRPNPRNPDVAPVSATELRRLFPGYRGEVRAVTFLPHRARRIPDRLLELLYPLLAALPGCRSHHLAVLVEPGRGGR